MPLGQVVEPPYTRPAWFILSEVEGYGDTSTTLSGAVSGVLRQLFVGGAVYSIGGSVYLLNNIPFVFKIFHASEDNNLFLGNSSSKFSLISIPTTKPNLF